MKNLRQSRLVKRLFRLKSRPLIGLPLRGMARLVRSEWLRPGHISPRNLLHNRTQKQTLMRFERGKAGR